MTLYYQFPTTSLIDLFSKCWENVLFGLGSGRVKYMTVLHATCLTEAINWPLQTGAERENINRCLANAASSLRPVQTQTFCLTIFLSAKERQSPLSKKRLSSNLDCATLLALVAVSPGGERC